MTINLKTRISPPGDMNIGPEKRSSGATDFRRLGGESNTPLTCHFKKGRNVFIDYLRVRFYGSFIFENENDLARLVPMFKILKINPAYFDEKNIKNYSRFYQYDDETFVMSSNEYTDTTTGVCHWLELKGQGCRAFEQRGGDWLELIEFCVKHATAVGRIDVSMDDTSGILSIFDVLQKVYNGEFSSNLRKWVVRDSSGSSADLSEIIRSKNNGCTIYFGTNVSKQLVIYNKAAERIAKNFIVEHGEWIRYECRFYRETGFKVLKEVYDAFKNNCFNVLVPSLIGGLVEFKESNNKRVRVAKIWSKWQELLGNTEKITVTNQFDNESSLASKQVWLASASGRILNKAFLVLGDEEFQEYIFYCMRGRLNKFDYVDLSQVNQLRKQLGKNVLSMEQAQSELNWLRNFYFSSDNLPKILKLQEMELNGEIYDNEEEE